jgi:hypothetical protein
MEVRVRLFTLPQPLPSREGNLVSGLVRWFPQLASFDTRSTSFHATQDALALGVVGPDRKWPAARPPPEWGRMEVRVRLFTLPQPLPSREGNLVSGLVRWFPQLASFDTRSTSFRATQDASLRSSAHADEASMLSRAQPVSKHAVSREASFP